MKKRVLILTKYKEEKSKLPKYVQRRVKELGSDCDIKYFSDVRIIFGNKRKTTVLVGNRDLSDYKSVFIRTIGREQITREVASIVARECEKRKIKFADSVYKHYVNENKLIAGYILNDNRVLTPLTYYAGSLNKRLIGEIKKTIGFPFIIKKTDSAKGRDVFLIKSNKELDVFLSKEDVKDYIFQEFLPNDYDYRVYITTNGKGFAITRSRTSKEEVTNNISKGGIRNYTSLSSKMKKASIKAAKLLGINFAGVDFIEHDKKIYVLEVNRAPSYSNMDSRGKRAFDFLAEFIN